MNAKTLTPVVMYFTICMLVSGPVLFAAESSESKKADAAVALTWQDNSRAMFDKVVQTSPEFIRPKSEKKLREKLVAIAGKDGRVTEEMVIEATKATTPDFVLGKMLKDLEPLRTKK
ncbi:MAG: hypothetical protein GY868_16450 [Deltaproteobacteria bacterium]|nr:hypothetical protein [Deltaproteobacteria bacterium]